MARTTSAKAKRQTAITEKVDAYQVITDRIILALESGVVPWHQPWNNRTSAPRSLSSRKRYQGVNVFTLLLTSMTNGYTSPWWGTYKQIAERGGQVRKGEKATPVIFWRVIEVKDDKAKDGKKKIALLRSFSVFNSDQADDLEVPDLGPALIDIDPIGEADSIITRYISGNDGPTYAEGGDRAFYSPSTDHVQVPLRGQFKSAEGYYSTVFHELGHSTGSEKRLSRDGITDPIRFGSEPYGREELIAEMTAAFLCGEAGVDQSPETNAGYIQSWLRTIKGDSKLVVQAAGAAQKAANLILGITPGGEEDGDDQSLDNRKES